MEENLKNMRITRDIKAITLRTKRSALLAGTSLELVKQKRRSSASRISGHQFAKHFLGNLIRETIVSDQTYLVAVKSVGVESAAHLLDRLVLPISSTTVIPVPSTPALYALLASTSAYGWLVSLLSSSSVYLMAFDGLDNYLTGVKVLLSAEGDVANKFFEVLFLKERGVFIDFRLSGDNSDAAILRKLYANNTRDSILFELNAAISKVPANLSNVFSISLLGVSTISPIQQ